MTLAIISMIHEPWGGSEELWGDAAAIALEQGDQVWHSAAVDGSHHPKIKKLIALGMQHHVRSQYVPDNKPLLLRAIIKRLYILKEKFFNRFAALKNVDAQVIVYIGTSYSIADDFDLLHWVQQKNIPFIIHANLNFEQSNLLSASQKQKIIAAYRAAQKIYFVSERNMQVAFKELGCSFANASVIRNPVNMSSVQMLPYPADSCIQMALVGNLVCAHKGQDIVINVLSSDTWKNKNWQLNIYGAGKDEAFLKQLVTSLGMEHKIIFHGKVANIRELWAQNHILLMPSHMEGMPLAVVEAMLCGRPVVATDVGGHTEWITHGKEGFIADKPAISSFEQALQQAWHRREQWAQMGIAAHHKALALTDTAAGRSFYHLLLEAAGKKI